MAQDAIEEAGHRQADRKLPGRLFPDETNAFFKDLNRFQREPIFTTRLRHSNVKSRSNGQMGYRNRGE